MSTVIELKKNGTMPPKIRLPVQSLLMGSSHNPHLYRVEARKKGTL